MSSSLEDSSPTESPSPEVGDYEPPPPGWMVIDAMDSPKRTATLWLAREKQALILTGQNAQGLHALAQEALAQGSPRVEIIERSLNDGADDAAFIISRARQIMLLRGLVCGLRTDASEPEPQAASPSNIGAEEVPALNPPLNNVFESQVAAVVVLLRQVGEVLSAAGGGKVLLLSSMLGFRPQPDRGSIGAAAAWMNSLGQALAEEWRRDRIQLTTICLPISQSSDSASDSFPNEAQDSNLAIIERGFRGLDRGQPLVFPNRQDARQARAAERSGGI